MTSTPNFLDPDTGDIDVEDLFLYAIEQRASDIHIKPGSPPTLRINGDLNEIEGVGRLSSRQTEWIVEQTMDDQATGQFVNKGTGHNYAYDLLGVGRFRVNAYKTRTALGLAARLLVDTPPSFDDLHTNPVIADLVNFQAGLILVTGITGSGKSTLTSAMIDAINASRSEVIIMTEDPIEIIHTDKKSLVIQREVGTDVNSFNDALKDALREDPNVIVIGEIRDTETAQACFKAAETGHLVISTLHSLNTTSSVSRLLELLDEPDAAVGMRRISAVLRGIVSQKLVKTVTPDRPLIPVNEILLNTEEMSKAIEENLPPSESRKIVEHGGGVGMQTFNQHFTELVDNKTISEETAYSQSEASQKANLHRMIQEAKERRISQVKMPVHPSQKSPVFSKLTEAKELSELSGKYQGRSSLRASAAPVILTEVEEPKLPTRPAIKLPPRS